MNGNDGSQNKIIYLEVLRIIAVFFVIFNHTGTDGFFLFSQRPADTFAFWLYLFVSVFCKFSVPIFLGISGALMLNRENEAISRWIKRIVYMVIILFVYSFGYYICSACINSDKVFSFSEFFKLLYSSNISDHLWYLYLYIAFLLSLPFLRALVKKLDNRYFIYLIALAIVFNGIIPCAEYILNRGSVVLNSNIKVSWVINSIVLYPCIGYYIHHRLRTENVTKWIPFLWVVNIITILISCLMTLYQGEVTGVLSEAESQTFFSSFRVINCLTIFLTVKLFIEKHSVPDLLKTIIISLGKCTFGIYLLHILIRKSPLYTIILEKLKEANINDMISIIIVCIVIMAVSYLITVILSKIPYIKKLVGISD